MSDDEALPRLVRTPEELAGIRARYLARFTYQFGDWLFCSPLHEVVNEGVTFHLTPTESDVLLAIVEAYPMPVSADHLDRTFDLHGEVRVYIRRIRLHLNDEAIIATNRGVGYSFNPPLGRVE